MLNGAELVAKDDRVVPAYGFNWELVALFLGRVLASDGLVDVLGDFCLCYAKIVAGDFDDSDRNAVSKIDFVLEYVDFDFFIKKTRNFLKYDVEY